MPLYAYLLLFGTIVLSGLSFFAFKTVGAKQLKLLLSFSGSYLFALTVLHLIPDVYHNGDHSIGIFISFFKFVSNFFQKVLNMDISMFTNIRMLHFLWEWCLDFVYIVFWKECHWYKNFRNQALNDLCWQELFSITSLWLLLLWACSCNRELKKLQQLHS